MADRYVVCLCWFRTHYEWWQNWCYQGTSVQVDFKESQTTIPLAAIKKLEQFAYGSGGLSDIWKCSISTRSGNRTVSLQTSERPIIYHNPDCCQIYQDPSSRRQGPTIQNRQGKGIKQLQFHSLIVLHHIRRFAARLMFGLSWNTSIYSHWRVSSMALGCFLR